MSVEFPKKEIYTTQDLLELMKILRSPQGCPWDREQTHQSIRSNLLEETCEAVEALDTDNRAALCEELGDVLLQVVFHAQIDEDAGGFSFDDVVTALCRKLIVRHPHVFGDQTAANADEVLNTWNAVKRATEGEGVTQSTLLKHLPRTLPSLMRAEKVQSRARRVGFDWPDVTGAWQALESETAELSEAMKQNDAAHMEEELGDLLFSAVNVSRFLHIDADRALSRATDKFIARFTKVEELAVARGQQMETLSPDALDALWQEAKTLL